MDLLISRIVFVMRCPFLKYIKQLTMVGILLATVAFSGCLESSPKTIYVDDDGTADYIKISDALRQAHDGDTIFVYNGTYYEKLFLDHSINLVGESRENTVFDFYESTDSPYGGIIIVNADNCTISNFRIIGIKGTNNLNGIALNSSYNRISNVSVEQTYQGIYLDDYSTNNFISHCNLSHNKYGISTRQSYNNNISNNSFFMNSIYGVYLSASDNNIISSNNITHNDWGLRIKSSDENLVIHNYIASNEKGLLFCCGAGDNKAYYNSFINNSNYNGQDLIGTNQWDDGEAGNYWDDYILNYPNATEINGVWDTPYDIYNDGHTIIHQDRYPLVNPIDE